MTEIILCCMMCVLLGIAFGCICMDVYFHSNHYKDKCLYNYMELKGDNDIPIKPERQFYNYDLLKKRFCNHRRSTFGYYRKVI